eukprot:GILJ01029553.1.p1 GENE.GILJ01029553.1~~GILJ01029553.1.p1  ORF type:complete len:221 (-),score=16.39 GILJ01029553.1:93-755(-)
MSSSPSLEMWHKRLSHLGRHGIDSLAERVIGLHIASVDRNPDGHQSSNIMCEPCIHGKMQVSPFSSSPGVSTSKDSPLDLVHSDVCGPMKTETPAGKRYFLTFIDDCTRFCWVYVLASKDQVFSCFRSYVIMVQTQLDRKLKVLRSDNGGEYSSKRFAEFCENHGIVCQRSAAYSPQQNGIAERKNRTLIEAARSMLFTAGMKFAFWGEAVMTAAYLQNR